MVATTVGKRMYCVYKVLVFPYFHHSLRVNITGYLKQVNFTHLNSLDENSMNFTHPLCFSHAWVCPNFACTLTLY